MRRNPTRAVSVGSIILGAGRPVAVQSMCATRTQDIDATVEQAEAIRKAGGDVVRIAVDSPKDVEALAEIRRQTPANLVVDLQENYRLAARVAPHVDKVRYNPGHLYHHEKGKPVREKVRLLVDVAREHDCALRIGVNCGSVDPEIKARFPEDDVQAVVESALEHCGYLEDQGFTRYVVSLKDSHPRKVIEANQRFAAARPDVPLHLGVTEAGIPPEGIIKSRVAFEQLLSRGIGDTLRVSLTLPNPRKHEEIQVGRQILSDIAAGRFRSVPVFDDDTLNIISCPSCSRVENEKFVDLAEAVKQMTAYAQRHALTIAVMGCRVNGPGETDDADLGLWCGPTHVNLKRKTESVGAFTYDEILPRLRRELDALIEARSAATVLPLPAPVGQVGVDHQPDQLPKVHARLPAQDAARLAGISQQHVHLGRTEVLWIHLDVVLPVEPGVGERLLQELTHRARLARRHDVVVGPFLLEHQPHRLHVVLGIAPVPFGVQVAEAQLLGLALLERSQAHGDLAGHEILAPAGRLVVEQDAVRDVHPIPLPVVHRHPVPVNFRNGVGGSRMEPSPFGLGRLLNEPEHLGAAGLIDTRAEAQVADRVQQPQHAHRRDVRGVLGHLEGHLDVALSAQVVDLLGLDCPQDPDQAVLVHEVAVMQAQPVPDRVDAPGIERAAAAHQAVNLVALLEQQLGEIAAILASDAGDQDPLRQT